MIKGKECPFCGGIKLDLSYSFNCFFIKCRTCEAEGPTVLKANGDNEKLKDKALAEWDKRIES